MALFNQILRFSKLPKEKELDVSEYILNYYHKNHQLPTITNIEAKFSDNKEINNISELLGYQYSRVEKDISIYKSNIEKMKQALEIIALNIKSN